MGNNVLGKTLKKARLGKCLSLRKAAKLIGMDATYLYDLEVNKNGNIPSVKKLRLISNALDLDYEKLLSYLPYVAKDLRGLNLALSSGEQAAMISFYRTCTKAGISLKDGVRHLQRELY